MAMLKERWIRCLNETDPIRWCYAAAAQCAQQQMADKLSHNALISGPEWTITRLYKA